MMSRERDKFKKFQPIINFSIIVISIFPKFIRRFLFVRAQMFQGYFGLGIRYILLKSLAKECGTNVSVFPGVYFVCLEELKIGNNVSIHPMCYIDAQGKIEIGNDVSIAHSVTLMSATHIYSDPNVNIKDQGLALSQISISDNVWIGAKATILSGINIKSGSIIGANSVVTKNVDENTIVGGIPAIKIKDRI